MWLAEVSSCRARLLQLLFPPPGPQSFTFELYGINAALTSMRHLGCTRRLRVLSCGVRGHVVRQSRAHDHDSNRKGRRHTVVRSTVIALAAACALTSCYDFNNPVDPRNAADGDEAESWVVVYEEDFSVPLGTDAGDQSLGFVFDHIPAEPTSHARVETTPTGALALRIRDEETGDRIEIHRSLSPRIGGKLRLELDIIGSTDPALHTSIALADGPTEVVGFRLFPGFQPQLYYYGASAGTELMATATVDQRYELRADIDTGTALFDVYLDGSKVATEVSFIGSITTVDRLRILTTDGSYGTTWLDNIRISHMQ